MYLIIVYDLPVEKISKIHKILRRYLNWVQNSVFEGDLTESKSAELIKILKKEIRNDDRMRIYQLKSRKSLGRIIQLGKNIKDFEVI